KPPVIPSTIDRSVDYGVFLAQDVFNRGTNDGQEVPVKGVDPIDSIAVIAARPTMAGEMNDFSANDFEKRPLNGMAPVHPDGPIVAAKCISCHQPTIVGTDTTAAAGNLDLTAVPDTTMMGRIFPRGYVNLSGESMMAQQEVTPAFPRHSRLIDYVLGLGTQSA